MSTPRWHTREDSGLRLDKQVRWWHDGELIEHPHIIEAFNRGLRVTDDGRFQLHFGDDWCFVAVEACAFTVVAVDSASSERLSIRLSDRTAEWLQPHTLALDDEGVLTVEVKNGKARARFSRDAQFHMAEFLSVENEAVVVRVGTQRWPTTLPPS
jgi:hypothetical protein